METEDEAKAAIAALDGYSVCGSHIHVEANIFKLHAFHIILICMSSIRRFRIYSILNLSILFHFLFLNFNIDFGNPFFKTFFSYVVMVKKIKFKL